MEIVPLGTNGFFPSFGRQTACFVIPYGKTLILLDAGSGLFRLAEKKGQKLLNGVKEIHLFLSHYHLDHTFGFYAAFRIFEGKKVTVFAQKDRKVFNELVDLSYFPVDYPKVHQNFHWEILKEGENKIADYSVLVNKQNHRGETSLAYKFNIGGKTVAYVTDGEPRKETIELIRNVDLLLHEHSFSGEEILNHNIDPVQLKNLNNIYYCSDGHVTSIGAAHVAKMAQVEKLVLIHHNPFADERQLNKQLNLAKSIFPKTTLAQDLHVITF